MATYLLRRLAVSLLALWAVTLVSFVIFHVLAQLPTPGAPPLAVQYWDFLKQLVLHASLGAAFFGRRDITQLILNLFPVTAAVVGGGALLWLAVSVPLGILSALRPRSLFDRSVLALTMLGMCVHPLVIGLALSYFIAFKAGLAPIQGYCRVFSPPPGAPCSGLGAWASHLVLPCLTLAILFAALYTRMVRAAVLEELAQDYVRTARAKGAGERRVLIRHVLRNVLLMLVTMLGMDVGVALGGAIYVEVVFGLPGLGNTAWISIQREDWPVLQGVVIFTGVVVIVMNLVVDLVYELIDPRLRLESARA
ncbi:MAG TPA: ABC transporter permease [Gaiellaceae bacterium]